VNYADLYEQLVTGGWLDSFVVPALMASFEMPQNIRIEPYVALQAKAAPWIVNIMYIIP
jgi:hypothetical protein